MSMEAVALDRRITPLILAFVVVGLAVATIGGAFAFQAAGILPCELCLKERLPYYAGMVLGALTILVAWRRRGAVLVACFALLALLFLGSAGFGAYHAGVEWGFWAGPSDCTGTLDRAGSMGDFMKQLQTVHVVRCDAVAIRILGLSLAGWNAVVSLMIAGVAIWGMRRAV
ncbi:disulfide bond formation protein B [Beijerinckia sp. L45]|uniref:disulfide bond formation protein B n=1 Tax=Beijerinckia sp. L45 TaxID=1641855 RepID=UPI0034CE70B0